MPEKEFLSTLLKEIQQAEKKYNTEGDDFLLVRVGFNWRTRIEKRLEKKC